MSQIRAVAFVAFLALSPSVAGADPLCPPLRSFVQSVGPHETRTFAFRTSWGEGFKDSEAPHVLGAKRCEHGEYAPAKAVCAYLMRVQREAR